MDKSSHQILSPFPTHRDLYVLVAGVLLGVLLGPAILGQLSPSTYRNWFQADQTTDQVPFDQGTIQQLLAMDQQNKAEGSETPTAARRLSIEHDDPRLSAKPSIAGLSSAVILVLAAVMLIETIIRPQLASSNTLTVPWTLGRLVTIRYALMSLWIAMILAQPALLEKIPAMLVALLLAVALLAGFIPLSPKDQDHG